MASTTRRDTQPKRRASADPKRPYTERNGQLLTPAEAADILAVTERQVWRLMYEGEIPRTYVGKLVRIHRDDLTAYIKRQRRTGR